MQYRVTYKNGQSEIIEAASYTVARGTAIFRKEDGGHTATVSFNEVRSITEVDESSGKSAGALYGFA
jgi:hypothetical protein